jgi:hypothetical protein
MADEKTASGLMELIEAESGHTKFKVGAMTVKAWKEGHSPCQTSQEAIVGLDGKFVACKYVDNKKGDIIYHNAVSVEGSVPLSYESGDIMSKGDWEEKDRRITRTAIAKSMIGAGRYPGMEPEDWFNWCWTDDWPKTESEKIPIKGKSDVKPTPQTKEQKIITQIALVVSEMGWTPEDGKNALVDWATGADLLNLEHIKKEGLRACDSQQLGAFLEHLKE